MNLDKMISENPQLISDFWIETATGKQYHFLQPYHNQINATDITVGLRRIPRYNGQCKIGTEWNVALHSLLVWRAGVEAFDPTESDHDLMLGLLLHDAVEAYVSDVTSPLKCLLKFLDVSIIKEIEDIGKEAIYERFGVALSEDDEKKIKLCDRFALLLESRELMVSTGNNWKVNEEFQASYEYTRHFSELTWGKLLKVGNFYTAKETDNMYLKALMRYLSDEDLT